jgi:hypothetical protein
MLKLSELRGGWGPRSEFVQFQRQTVNKKPRFGWYAADRLRVYSNI